MLQNRLKDFLKSQAEEEETLQAEQPQAEETTAGNDEPLKEEEQQPPTDEPQAEPANQEPPPQEEEQPTTDPEPPTKPKQKRRTIKVETKQNTPIPKPKNRPKHNEFIEKPPVSQEQAEKAANMVETVTSLAIGKTCHYFNPSQPETRYKLTPTEKSELRGVLAEYFKTVNWSISPTAALIMGLLSIYGGLILRAYMDNKAEKTRNKKADELRAKAAAIAAAEKARTEAAEKARAEAVRKTKTEKIPPPATPPATAAKPTPPAKKVLTELNEADEVINMKELTDGRSNFDLMDNNLYLKDENGKYLGNKNKSRSYKQSALIEKKRADLHKSGHTSKRVINKKLREYCEELRQKYGIKIITLTKHKPF
jgi:hypothetical protein